jgi:hypothetical protein
VVKLGASLASLHSFCPRNRIIAQERGLADSKVLHVSSSEWLRTRIAYEVKHLVDDLRSQIVLEYMRGNLTKKELRELFGKTAEDIDFIVEKTRKDLLKAKKPAK